VIGQDRSRDQARVSTSERPGMIAQLQRMVARPWSSAPMFKAASNKPSEHNTGKMARYIPVAQLAGERRGNQSIRTLVSHRIHFRPGTQSLGGT